MPFVLKENYLNDAVTAQCETCGDTSNETSRTAAISWIRAHQGKEGT